MPDRFARTVASIDTAGGHLIVCLIVILIGAAFCALKIPKGEDLIMAGSGALFMSMRGRGALNNDTDAPQQGARIPAPKAEVEK